MYCHGKAAKKRAKADAELAEARADVDAFLAAAQTKADTEITAAQMITALEGPIGLTECTVHPGQCTQEASCHVREPWQRINDVVRRALTEVTLADLAQPPRRPADPDTVLLSTKRGDDTGPGARA